MKVHSRWSQIKCLRVHTEGPRTCATPECSSFISSSATGWSALYVCVSSPVFDRVNSMETYREKQADVRKRGMYGQQGNMSFLQITVCKKSNMNSRIGLLGLIGSLHTSYRVATISPRNKLEPCQFSGTRKTKLKSETTSTSTFVVEKQINASSRRLLHCPPLWSSAPS